MALPTTASRIVHAGNGSTQDFPFPYYYLAKSHVKVVLVLADGTEQAQSETTHYTLTDPSESGGTVHMLATPANGQKLVIYREAPLTQEFEPVEGGALPAAELEKAVDKAFMVMQQLQDAISRSIVLSPATAFSNLRIPDPEASRILGWSSLANALVNYSPGTEVMNVFSALGQLLCSKATAAEMAEVFGGASPAIRALAAPAAGDAGKLIQVNAAGNGLQFFHPRRTNLVINGCMRVWQRGLGPSSNTHVADRWRLGNGTGGTVTHQRVTITDTQAPYFEGLQYALQAVCSVASSTAFHPISQRIEGARTAHGKTIVVSFYAQMASGTLQLTPQLVQSFGTGGSPSANVVTDGTPVTVTTSWQRFTQAIALPSVTGKTFGSSADDYLQLGFSAPGSSTFTVQIAGVDLRAGNAAQEFELRPIEDELRLCQRFFEKSYGLFAFPGAVDNDGAVFGARANGGTAAHVRYRSIKRVDNNNVTLYSPATGASGQARNINTGTDQAAALNASGDQGFSFGVAAAAVNDLLAVQWASEAEL